MSKLDEILNRLTGLWRSQDLAYTKDNNAVNKWHDEKINLAKSEIIKAVLGCLPKEKEPSGNDCTFNDCESIYYNQALSDARKAVEGL